MQIDPRLRAPPEATPPSRPPEHPTLTPEPGPRPVGERLRGEGWGRCTWRVLFFFCCFFWFFLCWWLLLFKLAETRQETAWEKVEQKWKNTNSPAANGLSVQTKVFSGLSPRAPTPARARTPAHTLARTHALPGEGRATASTACNRHTINNNRFLRSGLASQNPASAGGGGGAGIAGLGVLPSPSPGLLPGRPLRFTHPQGPHPSARAATPSPGHWSAGALSPPPLPRPPAQINKARERGQHVAEGDVVIFCCCASLTSHPPAG